MNPITKKELLTTMKIIKRVGPLIPHQPRAAFREAKADSPDIDMIIKHPDGVNTGWGFIEDPDYEFAHNLMESRNEVADLISDGHEVWIRKQAIVEGDPRPPLNDKEIRFIISFICGQHADDEPWPSEMQIFRIKELNGGIILTPIWAKDAATRQKFWAEFGLTEEFGPGWQWQEWGPVISAVEDGLSDVRREFINKIKVKSIRLKKSMKLEGLPCRMCNLVSENNKPNLEKYYQGLDETKKRYDKISKELQEFEEKNNMKTEEIIQILKKSKEEDIKESYEFLENSLKLKTSNQKLIVSYDELIQRIIELQPDYIVDNKTKRFFKCGLCGAGCCKKHAMWDVICHKCWQGLDLLLVKTHWPKILEEFPDYKDHLEEQASDTYYEDHLME